MAEDSVPTDFRILLTQELARLNHELLAIDESSMAPSLSRGVQKAKLRNALDATELALTKLEAGSYGVCEKCLDRIDPSRLEALPTTVFCRRCVVG